ncbi:MAG: YqgE/AlgH family protein [Betaproteobacteria bacterium]
MLAVLAVALLSTTPAARAEDLEAPLLLVAQPRMEGEFYGSTILVVRPVGEGRHLGFIVNRPTPMTLGKLFPGHEASQKVPDPVYLGGPLNTQFVFALVHRDESPGGRSLELAPGLYVAMDATTVDRIIETGTEGARFVAGLVAWDAGELADELKRGLWFVQEPEASIVLDRQVEGLWEKLVKRAEHKRDGI